jgi:hypothetical protein
MFKSTIVALFALSTLAIAAPAPAAEQAQVKRQSNSGQATYYAVGLGACGNTNSDSEA